MLNNIKVTFFSNFLNHHQTPFCDELYKQLDGNFTFVSTAETPITFLKNGYPDCTDYIYNLKSYLDETHYKQALQLSLESDIVIIGSAPDVFIQERLKRNKYTFRYSERLLKKGNWQLLDPRVLWRLLRYHTQYRTKNLYLLCASAFTAEDLNWVFAYPEKKYKWGYFTQVERLNIEELIAQKSSERLEIIWVARFIDFKHPELAVKLAYELKQKGYNFHLSMIGDGERLNDIQKLIKNLEVSDYVSLIGSLPNSEVKSYMKKSNIFIFTSDRNEGWGAVLNEAMSCGCAVVASNLIGAAPYLIKNNQNGLLFKSGCLTNLLDKTESLFKDQSFRNKLSRNAYYSLINQWSPENAASNFILLAKSILNKQSIIIKEGPCSIATKVSDYDL
jgi:glycosyltransferase involved in cell wall biosynthesis